MNPRKNILKLLFLHVEPNFSDFYKEEISSVK